MKTIDTIAARLLSLALATLVTATTLAGIDALAHSEHAAHALLAESVATAARPA